MKRLTVFLIAAVVLLGLIFVWWDNGMSAVDKKDKAKKVFVIRQNETVREIGNSLKKENLIKDPVTFFIFVKFLGKDKSIQAGDYYLSSSMDLKTVVDNLNHGTLDKWVTIPEGLRAYEIAEILKKNLSTYDDSWKEKLSQNEGYLFPDTYLIPKNTDIDLVISIMRGNFDKKVASIGVSSKNQNFTDKLIIASLIEREARYLEDMSLVSSVLHNRLEIGMKLDIDATVQYAVGYQDAEKKWWKKDLTIQDLKITSPYNTYKNSGLPPTPICNPGIVAIQAAINPVQTNYLYYVSDSSGHLHFAKTLAEHNTNIQKYIR